MNWFHYILITLALFISLMVYFAVRSTQTKLDLVSVNYYEEELKFQEKIIKLKNTQLWEDSIKTVLLESNKLLISFPTNMKVSSGSMRMYCPQDKSKDKLYELALDTNNKMLLDAKDCKGFYRIEIDWENEGEQYLTQRKIYF